MATPVPNTHGLNYLLNIQEVFIREKKMAVNEFEVSLPGGQILYTIEEDLTKKAVLNSNGKEMFTLKMMNSQNTELIWMQMPLKLAESISMEVYLASGQVISFLRIIDFSKSQDIIVFNDQNNSMLFRIKSKVRYDLKFDDVFNIYGHTGQIVGSITKMYGLSKREHAYIKADKSLIRFPDNLDVTYKAVLLCASLLIDHILYGEELNEALANVSCCCCKIS